MRANHLLYGWLLPVATAAILIEIAYYLLIRKRSYPWREMASSAGIYALHLPVKLITPAVVAPIAYFFWSHRLFTIPLNSGWGLGLLFLAEEFAYYWMHRAAHRIRWIWASHVVHHTPEHIHLASAFRLGATELLSGNWLFYLPLYMLGLNPLAVSAMLAINLAYQFWLHTNLVGRLGPLEWVFNTPSHHRVHHASNQIYLDRNYGGILIVWDRLFGTFAAERPDLPVTYGLVHPVGSLNPLKILFHEWAAIRRDLARSQTWRERLRAVAVLSVVLSLGGCGVAAHGDKAAPTVAVSLELSLAAGGLAILTPTAPSGHDEKRQVVAQAVTDAIGHDRPDLAVHGLSRTLSDINAQGLAEAYDHLYTSYQHTGLLDGKTLQQIGAAAGVRYLLQLQLAALDQSSSGSGFSVMGLSPGREASGNVRLLAQIWDGKDGKIVWEGARDASEQKFSLFRERKITVDDLVKSAAADLVKDLPR